MGFALKMLFETGVCNMQLGNVPFQNPSITILKEIIFLVAHFSKRLTEITQGSTFSSVLAF